ncbi:MAG: hypothetical protein H7099_18445 [Gemmatimonadaceae bacterium]|nr:hypothetical protein [Gemmatimonadaceae bacterium]
MSFTRKSASYTAHIVASLGWLGAILAYLALAVAGLFGDDLTVVRSAYRSMALIGWWVILPCSVGALITGAYKSWDTAWGVFRHWWIIAKIGLTCLGLTVLIKHLFTVSEVADAVSLTSFQTSGLRLERLQLLLHAIGGLLVVCAATVLSVIKPWGLTAIGQRTALPRQRLNSRRIGTSARGRETATASPLTSGWRRLLGIHAIGLTLLVLIAHALMLPMLLRTTH